MVFAYENQRVNFEILVKKYNEYVNLYKYCNNGSLDGVTPFAEFYWRMTYYSHYQDGRRAGGQGY